MITWLRRRATDRFFRQDSPIAARAKDHLLAMFREVNGVDFDVFDYHHTAVMKRSITRMKLGFLTYAVIRFREINHI